MVFVLVLFAVFGITGWQLGWFSENVPPIHTGNGTSTTETNPPTTNNPTPDPKDQLPNNPSGYTVKPGSEEILTEKGLLKKSTKRFYRYFNDKWSFSEENNPLNWKDLKDKEKPSMLKEYFTKNSQEENVKIEAGKKQTTDTKADAAAKAKAEADAAAAAIADAKADADAKAKAEEEKEKEKKDKCKTICDKLEASLKEPINNKNLQKKWLAKVNGFILDYNNNKCDCTEIRNKVDKRRAGL
jgi:predicted  nucleic acid-binding Zn-ribbon protein